MFYFVKRKTVSSNKRKTIAEGLEAKERSRARKRKEKEKEIEKGKYKNKKMKKICEVFFPLV